MGDAARPPSARHRLLAVLAGALGLLVLAAPAALAVGVNGVEIEADLPRTGARDRPTVEVGDEPVPVRLRVANITDEPRTVTIYVVGAAADPGGAPSTLLGRDDAPWVRFEEREVTLDGGEVTVLVAEVDPARLPGDGVEEHFAAFVVEAPQGEVVNPRAATVFRVVGERSVLVPLLLVLSTLALIVGTGAFGAQQLRRQRADEAAARARELADLAAAREDGTAQG